MLDLCIGNTSQIYQYIKNENLYSINSRDIDFSYLKQNKYNKCYLCFANQKTYDKNLLLDDYTSVNIDYTKFIIEQLKNNVNTFIIYLTAELYNAYSGKISLNNNFNYNKSNYIYSKELCYNELLKLKEIDKINIIFLYPFNFNSPYRRGEFLFNKFLNVIIKKEKITTGNLNFNRDVISPYLLANKTLNVNNDTIIGSGKLINIREYYKTLLNYYGIKYHSYVTEKINIFSKPNEFYYDTDNIYQYIIEDTIKSINEVYFK
jgi:nucleoside-diphosphate-sugar epimerase